MQKKIDGSLINLAIDEKFLAEALKKFMEKQEEELAQKRQQEETGLTEEELNKRLDFLEASFNPLSENKKIFSTFSASHVSPPETNLLEIDTPHDGSCLFYSVVLSFLLPVLNDDIQFNERITRLFGDKPQNTRENIKQILTNYDGSLSSLENSQLTTLINEVLRLRVVAFMVENEEFFAGHFIDNEFELHIAALSYHSTWGGDHEIRALSALLNVNINIYGNANLINYPSISSPPVETISLVYTSASNNPDRPKNHYHYLIHSSFIPGINSSIKSTSLPDNNSKPQEASKNSQLVSTANPKWQKIKEESESNTPFLFSYENLHQELIINSESPMKIIEEEFNGKKYYARRGNNHFPRGKDFIYCFIESNGKIKCEQGEIAQEKQLKLHISLPEDDFKLREKGWNFVKDLLVKNDIAVTKIIKEGIKMSESKLHGQETGGQRGKDITIYADNNPDLNFDAWLNIIKEITQAFQDIKIPGGFLPATIGARCSYLILNNPYCTYRYEADDKNRDEEHSDPFGDYLKTISASDLPWPILQAPNAPLQSKQPEAEQRLHEAEENPDNNQGSQNGEDDNNFKRNCCDML